MRVPATGGVGVGVEVRASTGVVLTNTNGACVVQGVGDDGDATRGSSTSRGGVAEVYGLPTGTTAAHRGCGWRETNRSLETASGRTTVVAGQVRSADGRT